MVCARNSYFCPQQSSSCSITQEPPQLHEPQVLFLSLSVIFLCYHIEVCVASRRASLPSLFLVSQMFSDFKIWPQKKKKEKRKESLCGSSRLKQLKCINSAPGPPPCQLYSAVTELSWQSESRAQIFGFLSTAAWSSVSLRPVGFDLSGGGNPHNLVMMSLFRAHQDQSASGAGGRVRTQGADRRTQTHTPRARTHAIIKK